MLDWLSSITSPQGDVTAGAGEETDEQTDIDLPDTPAPVFAVKAFKQALFGTPAPPERPLLTTRRNAANSTTASYPSKHDTKDLNRTDSKIDRAAISSPSKPVGILLTPGTGGARRKTVSFRNQMLGDIQNLATSTKYNASPKNIPGRYPSPHVLTQNISADSRKRSESRKPSSMEGQPLNLIEIKNVGAPKTEDITLDLNAPKSGSGRYWKQEYDSFATKSSLEVRKLAKKEQLAKKYARHKDIEASQLRGQLKQEQVKANKLEKQVAEYSTRLESAVRELERSIRRTSVSTASVSPKGDLTMESIGPAALLVEAEKQQLSKINAFLEASLRQSEGREKADREQIAQLQRENDELRNQLRTSTRVKHDTPVTRRPLSSDIWADLAADDCLEEASSKKILPTQLQSRSPLSHRGANLKPRTVAVDTKIKDLKSSQVRVNAPLNHMTDERRERLEAARKRLDDKKRNRDKTSRVSTHK